MAETSKLPRGRNAEKMYSSKEFGTSFFRSLIKRGKSILDLLSLSVFSFQQEGKNLAGRKKKSTLYLREIGLL